MLHLIHPAVVHFAVAFAVAGGTIEALGRLSGNEPWIRVGSPMGILAVPAVALAVLTGFLAENSLTLADGARAAAARHQAMGLAALAVLLVGLLWKAWFRGELPASHSRAYAVLLLVASVLVVVGAFHGGELVYVHGAGVSPG